MRILSIGNFGTGWDGSICDEEHIALALEELGHEVKRLQRGETIPLTNGPGPSAYDWVLIAQWDSYDMDWLHKLKNYFMCPLIYWAFDHQDQFQEWHLRLIAESDLYLSKRLADAKFSNWQWLSQDFAPSFLDKVESGKKDIDVLFTGSYLDWATERNETIKAVGEHFNLVIHSVNSWPQGNEGPVMDNGLPELYARAKVVLSIDHTIDAGYWSDRNAQAMACGAFVLCRYVPMMTSVFRNNIAYFYNTKDCIEKLGNLLQPQFIPLRAEISKKAYEYAHTNLMVRNRVMDLLTIVEGIL